MEELLDDILIAKSSNKWNWTKLALLSIFAVIVVGIYYQKSVFGSLTFNDIFDYISISFLQSLIVSVIVAIGSFVFNLIRNRNLEFIKSLHFYMVSIVIGNSTWIVIMIIVILIGIIQKG